MSRLHDNRGQTVAITVVFITALLVMTAFVLDVASWYRADRAAQATADAAALAAAQALPDNPSQARLDAVDYADRNGGGVTADRVELSGELEPNDTVRVRVERQAPGFFARMFGIDSVTVGAKAAARASALGSARYVAPVVVNNNHPLLPGGLGCNPRVCDPVFGESTELELLHLHGPGSGDAAGAFGLIDLRVGGNGSPGSDQLGEWFRNGYSEAMPLGVYESAPGSAFNSSHFRDALRARLDSEVLIPIYDTLFESGSNAEFNVIGWIGFVPTGFTGGGSSGRLVGYFTRVIWQGIPATSAGRPAYGARVISLVE